MKNKYNTWSYHLVQEWADYNNTLDSLGCGLSDLSNIRRLETMEERYIFDLWYFWACADSLSRCRRQRALFSSPQFRQYTSKNVLMCNWWNSLKFEEKSISLLKELQRLHRTNTRNVSKRRPFQWTDSITEHMVSSVGKVPIVISNLGPDGIIVYGKHETQPASEEVFLKVESLTNETNSDFAKVNQLSRCVKTSCLLLPGQELQRSNIISNNLKWIIFVNTGYECIEGYKKDIYEGIRLLRQRLRFLGLKRVRLIDVSVNEDILGCEKVEIHDLGRIIDKS